MKNKQKKLSKPIVFSFKIGKRFEINLRFSTTYWGLGVSLNFTPLKEDIQLKPYWCIITFHILCFTIMIWIKNIQYNTEFFMKKLREDRNVYRDEYKKVENQINALTELDKVNKEKLNKDG